MKDVECLVIGGGPAGLSAAIAAAQNGVSVLVVDENAAPGGQLFKQIHKFFGSQDHQAGIRGYAIGRQLLKDAETAGVNVLLNTRCFGIFDDNVVGLVQNDHVWHVHPLKVIIATGASENALAFPGCTLPGVMTAGAAQTLINVHRVMPGKRVVVVGTGNVGLIVGYQLLQAGAQLACVVEAAPTIGGYAVHANKLRRAGVPFYLGHTVVKAAGKDSVKEVHIAPVDNRFCPIMEKSFVVDADTIALAVGLHPRIELSQMAGANIIYNSVMGGHIPNHNADMKIQENFFVAGDASGVEEASTAMEEGRLAGLAAAVELGRIDPTCGEQQRSDVRRRLQTLRSGDFGTKRAAAKAEIFARCTICTDEIERK